MKEFILNDKVKFFVHQFHWFMNEQNGEIGEVYMSSNIKKNIERYSVWFDEDGAHYLCLQTYEQEDDGKQEMEIINISEFLDALGLIGIGGVINLVS
jgi:hypothetical protein